MRIRAAALVCLLVLVCGGPSASARQHDAYRFLAGAGSADTTPPLAGSAAGAQADALFAPSLADCPGPLFPSAGRFALQEPFSDQNGDNQWDAGGDLNNGPDGNQPDPFCDIDANGRWDGIYADNGRGPATGVHDPIDARAVAISDGRHKPVVYVSVKQIGVFDYYTDQARADLLHTYGVDADLVVSANHNESSPDSIGLYGALQSPVGVGTRSGINEYFMQFLDDRIARAAAAAVHDLQPAQLYANQVEGAIPDGTSGSRYPLLNAMTQRISDQFPTSVALPGDNRVAAVDPKMGVLQARTPKGTPIFTVISLAAHNQEMGNAGTDISGDWPGALEHAFDATHAGMAMFLVGDNGSEEDPQTDPVVVPNGSENHTNQTTQFIQAQATGARFAQIASGAVDNATRLTYGPVQLTRKQFCIPLENNGFIALAAAGEFGLRQAYVCDPSGNPVAAVPNGAIAPTVGTQFRTFVSYTDVGPDLQLIDNPGEAFPALMLGSPFGVDDESCDRPNPSVPTWHARALYRFQVGLADDLIGYLIPAWGFASGTPGLFNNDTCSSDMHGHRHKLESESTGPTSANLVADNLTELLSKEPDPSAHVVQGRFVLPDGSLSRWPTGAVGVLAGDKLIGAPGTTAFGSHTVDAQGVFMDYDGQPQAKPDVTTRGIMVLGRDGCVSARYYLDVFPAFDANKAGAAVAGRSALPKRGCDALSKHGVPELQPGAAKAAGLAVANR